VDAHDLEKRAAGEAAAGLVRDGMTLGLGTGSTAAFFLLALARRAPSVRCVATSSATEAQAAALGIRVEPFEGTIESLDLAVDGADQVDAGHWLVKGGGGAHTREKIVAAASARFVVIASPDKLVDRVGAPVPLELFRFGLAATLRRLSDIGPVELREASATPDGGVLADYRGPVDDPHDLSAALSAVPGVVDHGLFPPWLVSFVIVGRADGTAQTIRTEASKAT
jgi:ribose 5-phosphate isomerase A